MGSTSATLGGLACVLALLATSAPAAADQAATPTLAAERAVINLPVNLAEIVRLERPASTIVVGNPGIADATLGDERSLVLTGRAAGTTNVIALDTDGDEIANLILRVPPGPPQTVRFFHGTERRTYFCGQGCEPVLSVGDEPGQFGATREQIQGRQEFSTPAAAQ